MELPRGIADLEPNVDYLEIYILYISYQADLILPVIEFTSDWVANYRMVKDATKAKCYDKSKEGKMLCAQYVWCMMRLQSILQDARSTRLRIRSCSVKSGLRKYFTFDEDFYSHLTFMTIADDIEYQLFGTNGVKTQWEYSIQEIKDMSNLQKFVRIFRNEMDFVAKQIAHSFDKAFVDSQAAVWGQPQMEPLDYTKRNLSKSKQCILPPVSTESVNRAEIQELMIREAKKLALSVKKCKSCEFMYNADEDHKENVEMKRNKAGITLGKDRQIAPGECHYADGKRRTILMYTSEYTSSSVERKDLLKVEEVQENASMSSQRLSLDHVQSRITRSFGWRSFGRHEPVCQERILSLLAKYVLSFTLVICERWLQTRQRRHAIQTDQYPFPHKRKARTLLDEDKQVKKIKFTLRAAKRITRRPLTRKLRRRHRAPENCSVCGVRRNTTEWESCNCSVRGLVAFFRETNNEIFALYVTDTDRYDSWSNDES